MQSTSRIMMILSGLCLPCLASSSLPLANLDFEEGMAGWIGDNGKSVVCPQAAHSGKLGLRVTDNDPQSGSSFRSQTIPAHEGTTYRLRFWAHIPKETSGLIGVYFIFKDEKGNTLARPDGGEYKFTLSCIPNWRQLDYVETSPKNTVSLAIWIHSFNATTGLTADFDDFELAGLTPQEAQNACSTWLPVKTPFPKSSPQRIAELEAMLPYKLWKPGPPFHDRSTWDRLAADPAANAIISRAEKILATPQQPLTDELYLDFHRSGIRTTYENIYHRWEPEIQTLAVAECLENKGRFLPEIIRRLEELCNMRSWLMPAHDRELLNFNNIQCYADLGSSARGWTVMSIDAWLDDKLPQSLRERLRQEIHRRILQPCLDVFRSGELINELWWMNGTNNWNAVCTNNVTGMALALIPDKHVRAEFLAGMEISNKFFLTGFREDGYCTEGVSYWGFGFGHFLALAETVLQATDGKLNILEKQYPLLEKVARYGTDIQLTRRLSPPFADCRLTVFPFKEVLLLIQRRFPQALTQRVNPDTPLGYTMPTFEYDAVAHKPIFCGSSGLVLEHIPCFGILGFGDENRYAAALPESAPLPEHSFFPTGGVVICRPANQSNNRLSIALKGGHNAEHHNHNDIGSFVLAVGDEPLIQDPGREEYSGQTFGVARYTFPLMNSWGHSVPFVAGKLQKTGRQAEGIFTTTSFSAEKDVVVIDMKAAYDIPQLKKLTRTMTYDRQNAVVTIQDDVEFTSPQAFGTALVSFADIRQSATGQFIFKNNNETLHTSISSTDGPLLFNVTTLKTQISPKPRRLGIDFQSPVTRATITMVFTTK